MKRILVLLLVCLLTSCGKKEEKEKAPPPTTAEWLEEALDLDKAIVQTPPRIVSTTAHLDIEFRDPVVPSHLEGGVLDKNPFEFVPPIQGHAKWFSQRILRFVPDERLPAGRTIKGTLYGKVAFGEQKNVNDFRFTFKVAEQEVLRLEADFVPTPEVENGVTYKGTVTFAQPVDLDKIQSDLAFEGPRGKLGLDITRTEAPDEIGFTSEVIVRTEKGQNFTISLPRGYTAEGKKWEQSIFLPGMGEFKVVAHMDMTPPGAEEPTYGFRFSDPIKEDIDLSGYITIEPEIDYTMRIDGKYLLVEGDFYPGRSYDITIAEGFPSIYGTKRAMEFRSVFSLSNIKPEVQWLSEGVYLPTDNNYRLQFKSVNISRVRVTVTEIFPQNIGFFIQNNPLDDQSDRRAYPRYRQSRYRDLNRVGEQVFNEYVDITEDWNEWVKTELDLNPVFDGKRNSVFVVELQFTVDDLVGRCVNARDELEEGGLYYESTNYYDNPCQPGYYYQRGHLGKLLIASNIGLTVKKAEAGLHVFAADVLTAHPVGGLELDLFTYQNKYVETRTTDAAGYALFTGEGAYIFGRHTSGIALIKDHHPSWQLNNFDVGGSSGGKRGIDVFVYTDRGVHRPGDTVHLSAIVRFDRARPPEQQPVTLEVKDPLGQVVHQAKANCGFNGHVYFPIVTDLSDPTGAWLATLQIGDEEFTPSLRIETVKPNRLKVEVDIPDAVRPPRLTLEGTVTCKYLFGAPGANLKCNMSLMLGGRRFTVDDYRDFIFESPLKRFESRTLTIFEGKLDARGMREFQFKLPLLSNAPGIVGGSLRTTVYEKGGNPVSRSDITTIYPFTSYVGIKDVFQWGSARVGENFDVPIVVVDDKGESVAGRKLKVAVYVNRHHWWWHYDRRDQKDFRKMESTYLIGEYTYMSKSTPITHPLAVEDYGRHLIEVTDVTSGHETGLFFYATQWGRPAPTEEKERNFLQISSDKNVYNVGDVATLTFDTPGEGMALFTLEQGEKILHREWKPVRAGRTSFAFSFTGEMIPNCYASISLIQPHNQNTNDLPMRLYGVKTLYVEDQSTHLPIEMAAPDELRPKQSFTVDVTSHAAERATYTIAIVDDGLLDLTGFETPSPWDYFFDKIRLGVVTLDNYDDIIGVLFPDIDRYFSIGGGEMFEAERKKRLDRSRVKRFEPVVLFRKPIAINPGQTKRASFEMPNYVGSVRIMVVGAAGHSYAMLEKTVPVKQELMILPTLPRVARPGDTFSLPVSVFATDSTIRSVDLSLALSANLDPEGPSSISLPFEKLGEKDTVFRVSVGDAVGADTATFTATSGPFSADYTVHMPVTSPNPFYTEVTDTTVLKDQPVTLTPEKFGLEGTNQARIAFSRMPDIQLDKRFAHLIRYPYGCIEQTVSAAFPQIFLPFLVDLEPHRKKAVTDNINATIKKLRRFRMDKGFAFWPSSNRQQNTYTDWGTTYAGHFLVEARELGYHVPEALYDHWLKDAKRTAKKVNKKNHRYQTYRLFVLALAGEPHIGAMNLVRENYLNSLDPLSRKLLAAAYYVTGSEDIARAINDAAPTEITDYRELSGTYGSALRDRALMTYLCVKMNDMRAASYLLRVVANAFRPWGWYSTQETAMAILGVGAYSKGSPFPGGAVKFNVKMGDAKPETITLSGYQTALDLEDMWGKPVTIENESDNPLFVSLFEEGIPLESRIETERFGIELTRNFYGEDGNVIDVSARPQGEPFWVIYKVQSTFGTPLEELALTSVFPSGWEILNPRMTMDSPPSWVTRLRIGSGEYMDIRDDRVNWFFDLSPGHKTTFGVKINPTFTGSYALPPVAVEAMYSPEFYARIAGGRVSVR